MAGWRSQRFNGGYSKSTRGGGGAKFYKETQIKEETTPQENYHLIPAQSLIDFTTQHSKEYASGLSLGWQSIEEETVNDLNNTMVKYDIESQNEVNHFISQCFIESWYGRALTEINWRDYPDTSKDKEYFNEKYGGRTDLGNRGKDTNDGYLYRGGGYIHLTGRANYQAFADQMLEEGLVELDENGENPIMKEGADYVAKYFPWEAAGFYWDTRVKSKFDGNASPSVSDVTVRINSGKANLKERTDAYNLLSSIFGE